MNDVCDCETPCPRQVGVHPNTCIKCQGIIE